MIEKYKKLLKNAEYEQRELMDIENYDEDVYQAYQKLIDELEHFIEDNE